MTKQASTRPVSDGTSLDKIQGIQAQDRLPQAQPQAPQRCANPGSVQGGYRFKGSNPADPNAWDLSAMAGPWE